MAKITTLFVDKGGVLVDNTTLGPQDRRFEDSVLRAFDEVERTVA